MLAGENARFDDLESKLDTSKSPNSYQQVYVIGGTKSWCSG